MTKSVIFYSELKYLKDYTNKQIAYSHIFSNFDKRNKTNVMSDNFFEHSTAAVGTIITVVLLAILASVMIWG